MLSVPARHKQTLSFKCHFEFMLSKLLSYRSFIEKMISENKLVLNTLSERSQRGLFSSIPRGFYQHGSQWPEEKTPFSIA